MPTISISRDYSTSKNLKMFILSFPENGDNFVSGNNTTLWEKIDLANGLATYPKKASSGNTKPTSAFNRVPNLQEIPDLTTGENGGGSNDTIEITTLQDAYHEFADGLKNRGTSDSDSSLAFTFLYDKNCYDALQKQIALCQEALEAGGVGAYYQIAIIVLPDNSYFAMRFKDISTVFRGAGINSALTFQLNITLDGGVYWNSNWNAVPFSSMAGELVAGGDSAKGITASGTNDAWTASVLQSLN